MNRLSRPLLVGLLALAGCAEEATDWSDIEASSPMQADEAVTGDTDQVVTADIGPEGGALDSDFGVSVTVPQGALNERTTITVVYNPGGPSLRFEPMGIDFRESVFVDLPAVEEYPGADAGLSFRCFAANMQACLEAPSVLGDAMHPWLTNAAAEYGDLAAPDTLFNEGTFGASLALD